MIAPWLADCAMPTRFSAGSTSARLANVRVPVTVTSAIERATLRAFPIMVSDTDSDQAAAWYLAATPASVSQWLARLWRASVALDLVVLVTASPGRDLSRSGGWLPWSPPPRWWEPSARAGAPGPRRHAAQ